MILAILMMVLVLVILLGCLVLRKKKEKHKSRSQHIILPETKESRHLVESMRTIMEATYKNAFQLENIEATIQRISQDQDLDWSGDNLTGLARFFREDIFDTRVYHLQKDEAHDSIIIVFHGGAYLYGITDLHQAYCVDLAMKTKARVVVPLYRRLPEHHCEEAYTMFSQVYQQCLRFGKPIIFAGDSSGGGLALGFYQYCQSQGIKLPAGLILISPWLDVTLSNPAIQSYESEDMMLSVDGLRRLGKIWAEELDERDYRVSPIYGSLDNLPETLIFSGTQEIMEPDCKVLFEKTKDDTFITFIEGEGLYHTFALSELTEQGKQAREMMVDMIHRIEKQEKGDINEI